MRSALARTPDANETAMRTWRYLIGWPVALSLYAGLGQAQDPMHLDLDRFAPCPDCQLRRVADLRLAFSNPDLIETEAAWAAFDANRGEYVLVSGPGSLALLDGSGRYLRTVGRRGRGPGEFEVIRDVRFLNGHTYVMDVGQGRWTVFDSNWELVNHAPLPLSRASRFLPLTPDTMVIAAMGVSPAGVGFPLHVVSLTRGAVLRHLGSETGEFNAGAPWADQVLIARGTTSRTTWLAKPHRLRFEEWSLDASQIASPLRVVEGAPEWFPPVGRIPPFGEKPATRMREFAFDRAGKLWVVSWVAAADWQRGVETAQRTPDGEVFIEPADYFATRVDIYDLRRRIHYGSLRLENHRVRLLDRDGEMLLQLVEYESETNVYLALYRVEF